MNEKIKASVKVTFECIGHTSESMEFLEDKYGQAVMLCRICSNTLILHLKKRR